MSLFKCLRKFSLLVISLAFLVAAVSTSVGGRFKVSAAGESFTWIDAKTIRISGGDLTGTYTANLRTPVALPAGTPPEIVAATPQYSDTATISVTHKSGCSLSFTIGVVDSDTLDIKAIEPGPSISNPGSSAPVNCQPFLYNTYTRTVTTSNNRSDTEAATETQAQKKVTIKAQYAGDAATAPATASFVITGVQGTTTTLNLVETVLYGATYQSYQGAVYLGEGNYEGCDSLGIGCKSFAKQKYETLLVEYGESAQGGSVLVNLTITYTGLSPDELHSTPSIPVTITSKADANITWTESTESHLSSVRVEDYVLNRDVTFGRVPPGTYKACALSICEDFTKTEGAQATINLNATGANVEATFITEGEDLPSCESAIDNGFGWIICPILDGTDKLINMTEGIIKDKLEINSEFTNNEGLHDAWTQLARISSGLLVIVALVMIISTALGAEMVSSYTMKKMLPRIVIGAIGIWLSWALATTYVNLMNDLGRGITGILFEPFKDTLANGNSFADVDLKYIVQKSFTKTDPTTDLSALAIFSVPIVSLVVGSSGIFGILAAAIPALGAMLIGLFLLTLRQIIIVFLLVLAPIGVAAWMLPNTEKVWKLWSGTFNKLLLMYPLFMGAFAAGKIFALIAADATKTDNGVLEVIVPMLAYISPFFFIPVLFKLAGSIFGNLTGMVNNKGKGVFDKLKGNVEKRAALSNRSLGRTQRENLRKINRQAGYAEGMTGNGDLARLRRRTRAGRFGLNSQENRNRMQAGAWGIVVKDEEDTLRGGETMLEREFMQYRAGGGALTEGNWLLRQAQNSRGEMQQSALSRMAKTRSLGQLQTFHGAIGATDTGTQRNWELAVQKNGELLHKIAPHIAQGNGRAFRMEALDDAAVNSMSEWNTATWEAYRDRVTAHGGDVIDAVTGETVRDRALAKIRGLPPPAGAPAGTPPTPGLQQVGKPWGDMSPEARDIASGIH